MLVLINFHILGLHYFAFCLYETVKAYTFRMNLSRYSEKYSINMVYIDGTGNERKVE